MKIVVYSCITGGRDHLINIDGLKEDGIDYVMFTDNPPQAESGWDVRPVPKEWINEDPHMTSRYPKINPHIVFPDYDYSIWLDGNMFLKHSIKDYLEVLGEEQILTRIHPARNCAYDEAKEIIRLNFDHKWKVYKTIRLLEKEGFPKKYGLSENGLILRRHNDKVSELNDMWWDMLTNFSRRDQLSLQYCLWKLDIKNVFIANNSVLMVGHAGRERLIK